MTNQNSKIADEKNSLFDDSFFEDDDEEEDDFDFDEDDIEDAENAGNGVPVQSQMVPESSVQQNKNLPSESLKPSKLSMQSELNVEQNIAHEIQFRLGCELGQILIPYENLQNLNIGSVVDFNNTLQTLYLSVNNVRVGEGMLVDVDGKIGIKITRWYGRV